MKFLFIGQGYPGVELSDAGSGIGTYLREMCLGLTGRGHECHVVVWKRAERIHLRQGYGGQMAHGASTFAKAPADKWRMEEEEPNAQHSTLNSQRSSAELKGQRSEVRSQRPESRIEHPVSSIEYPVSCPCTMPSASAAMRHAPCALPLEAHQLSMDGVTIHLLAHSYWPVIEKFAPDSRDIHNLRMLVRQLNTRHGFDWIEIESEEGIALGIQKDFPDKTVLRIHTTLAQMVQYKDVPRSWTVDRRLAREIRSFRAAKRVVTHSRLHAEELGRLFPFLAHVVVVPHGVDFSSSSLAEQQRHDRSAIYPSFLIIGSADRRKGFDRIRPVIDAYAAKHGACRVVIVSECAEQTKAVFGLVPPWPLNVQVEWRERISTESLAQEYRQASALLHLARYESFGLPLIEAAAFGVPVVTTPVGIALELMTGDLQRYLVDGDNAETVAETLAVAVGDTVPIGAALRKRYEDSHTRDCMVQNYLHVLVAEEV